MGKVGGEMVVGGNSISGVEWPIRIAFWGSVLVTRTTELGHVVTMGDQLLRSWGNGFTRVIQGEIIWSLKP